MKKQTHDVKEYVNRMENDSLENIYGLYESIAGEKEMGNFKCTPQSSGELRIEANDAEQTLILGDAGAKENALYQLDKEYGGDFGKVSARYENKRNQDNHTNLG